MVMSILFLLVIHRGIRNKKPIKLLENKKVKGAIFSLAVDE